jgi:predicted NBD/HSP70 family sugar kinase
VIGRGNVDLIIGHGENDAGAGARLAIDGGIEQDGELLRPVSHIVGELGVVQVLPEGCGGSQEGYGQ